MLKTVITVTTLPVYLFLWSNISYYWFIIDDYCCSSEWLTASFSCTKCIMIIKQTLIWAFSLILSSLSSSLPQYNLLKLPVLLNPTSCCHVSLCRSDLVPVKHALIWGQVRAFLTHSIFFNQSSISSIYFLKTAWGLFPALLHTPLLFVLSVC